MAVLIMLIVSDTVDFFYVFDVACLVFSETKKSRISDKENTSAFCGLENEGVFEELLRTSGIVLKAGEGQNEIGTSLTLALSAFRSKPARMAGTK